jgi:hypothetical protein
MANATAKAASKFDELLVQLEEEKESIYKQWVRTAIRLGSLAFILLGLAFFLFFLWEFADAFIITHPSTRDFAEFWGHFGEAAGGAINMMGLGGLIYSLLFVAEQVKGEKDARLQHDMPVVFVAPRLVWSLSGVSQAQLVEDHLALYVGFRNMSNAAATHLEFTIVKLNFCSALTNSQAEPILNLEEKLFDNLPGHEVTSISGADSSLMSMSWPLDKKCPGLIDQIFHYSSADAALPYLQMTFTISFRTIRGARFCSHGTAIWSPRHCRDVKEQKQPNFLNEFSDARKEFEKHQVGLDRFFRDSEENPLVPTITVIPKIELKGKTYLA